MAMLDRDLFDLLEHTADAALAVTDGGEILSWNASASYSLNEHLKLVTSYSYFRNLSNVSLAEFDRQQFSVTASSRF